MSFRLLDIKTNRPRASSPDRTPEQKWREHIARLLWEDKMRRPIAPVTLPRVLWLERDKPC